MKVDKVIRVEGRLGLSWELASLIVRRTSSLDAELIFRGPLKEDGSREGWRWSCKGTPNFRNAYLLTELDVDHGEEVRVIVEGPKAEVVMGEIEHLLADPDPEPHGAPCMRAELGPRGRWDNIPAHSWGNPAATNVLNQGFARARAAR